MTSPDDERAHEGGRDEQQPDLAPATGQGPSVAAGPVQGDSTHEQSGGHERPPVVPSAGDLEAEAAEPRTDGAPFDGTAPTGAVAGPVLTESATQADPPPPPPAAGTAADPASGSTAAEAASDPTEPGPEAVPPASEVSPRSGAAPLGEVPDVPNTVLPPLAAAEDEPEPAQPAGPVSTGEPAGGDPAAAETPGGTASTDDEPAAAGSDAAPGAEAAPATTLATAATSSAAVAATSPAADEPVAAGTQADEPVRAEPGDDPASTDEPTATAAGASGRSRIVAYTLAGTMALLLVAAVVLGLQVRSAALDDRAREQALTAARQAALNLTSIDQEDFEGDVARVLDGATGEFRSDFTARVSELETLLTENEVVAEGRVLEAAIVRSDRTTATALVVVDSTVRNTAVPEGRVNSYRMKVEVERVGDSWLASSLEFVG